VTEWFIPIVKLAEGEDTKVDRIVWIGVDIHGHLSNGSMPRHSTARIAAALNRISHDDLEIRPARVFSFLDFEFDVFARTCRRACREIPLTNGEFDLLAIFVDLARSVLSRAKLLQMTREGIASKSGRSIDVQVGRLRQKIEAEPKNPQLIKTVRGGGYIFTAEVIRT
jgi:two-component system OmpR family response regulator